MNQYFVERISEFHSLTKPFQAIWKTILLQAGWFECEGAPRPLVISIRLLTFSPAKGAFDPTPEVGPFRVSCAAIPAGESDKVFEDLKAGAIDIQGTKLKLERRDGTKWVEMGSPFVNFERPGIYNWREQDFPRATLHQSDSISDNLYDPVRDRRLEELWRAKPAPYWDRADVLKSFFGVGFEPQQDQILLCASAEIPMRLGEDTHLKGGRVKLAISIPAGADPEKVSIGCIASSLDGATKRLELNTRTRWRKTQDEYRFIGSVQIGRDVTRASLLFRYAGITLERRELLPIGSRPANAAILAHESVDPEGEFYREALAGRGKEPGKDFERAVAWLLAFCGFSVMSYAKLNHLEQQAPDLLATSKRDDFLLAVECTISSPNTQGKLAKLRDRCREIKRVLGNKAKVIPVLATALEGSVIPASDRSLAMQDEIMLLPLDHLSQLHGMASAGQPLPKVVSYLRRLRAESRPRVFGQSESDE